MATNEFLPFATAGGANVLAQSDWQALAARLSGYTAGVANSAQINKGLRQSSAMAAMIGQFINTYGGLDALDNADIAALMANFAATYRSQATNYVSTVGGTANALTVTLAPAPSAMVALLAVPLRLKISTTNTAAVTLNVNGLGAVAVKNLGGADMVRGQLVPGIVELAYDGVQFQLLGMTPGLFARGGRLRFGSSGSWTVPAGVYSVYVECLGGGGSGGSASGSGAAATGGNGGAYGAGIYAVTPGDVIAVTVGGGGPSPAAGVNNGIAGGASSFGSFLTANGGFGGVASGGGIQTAVGANATVSGANVVSLIGSQSQPAYNTGASVIVMSPGGAPPMGPYGDRLGVAASGTNGNNAVALGQGGNGAVGNFAGGGGAAGYVQLFW